MKDKRVDGLRGIAALNVAFSHFVCAFLPMMLHRNYPPVFRENPHPSFAFDVLSSPPVSLVYNGQFAVLVFFVLSGYVLTLPYFRGDREAIQKRLWGRYLRLNIPIAASIFLSFAVYKLGGYVNIPVASISGSQGWLNNFFQSGLSGWTTAKEALYQSIVFGNGTLVPPLWTLRVEFIGSLYILLYYLVKPASRTALTLALVLLFLFSVYGEDFLYFAAIFLGAHLSFISFSKKWNWPLLILGLYLGAFQFESRMYDYLPSVFGSWDKRTFYNVIGALAVVAPVINGLGARFFESKPIQFLGRISYSLYLTHFIVLCSLGCALYRVFPHSVPFLLLILLIYISCCFLLSSAFERWIDRPAIRLAHIFSKTLFQSSSGKRE